MKDKREQIPGSGYPAAAVRLPCFGVDISGGVETDGFKDRQKIKIIINIACAYGNSVSAAQNGGN